MVPLCNMACRNVDLRGGEGVFADWSKVDEMVVVAQGELTYHFQHSLTASTARSSFAALTSNEHEDTLSVRKNEWACEVALWANPAGLDGPLVAANGGSQLV